MVRTFQVCAIHLIQQSLINLSTRTPAQALHRPDYPSYHRGGRMPAPTGAGAIHRSPSAAYACLSHAYEQPSPQFPHPALAFLPPSPPPPPPPWKPSPYVTVSSALSSPGMLMRQQREWARRQWRTMGQSITSACRSAPAPPAALPLRALPPPTAAAAGADDDGGAAAAGAGAVAPDSLVPFSPRSFHRNNVR